MSFKHSVVEQTPKVFGGRHANALACMKKRRFLSRANLKSTPTLDYPQERSGPEQRRSPFAEICLCNFLTQLVTMLQAVMEGITTLITWHCLCETRHGKVLLTVSAIRGVELAELQQLAAWSPRLVGRQLGLGDSGANMRHINPNTPHCFHNPCWDVCSTLHHSYLDDFIAHSFNVLRSTFDPVTLSMSGKVEIPYFRSRLPYFAYNLLRLEF